MIRTSHINIQNIYKTNILLKHIDSKYTLPPRMIRSHLLETYFLFNKHKTEQEAIKFNQPLIEKSFSGISPFSSQAQYPKFQTITTLSFLDKQSGNKYKITPFTRYIAKYH